MIVALVQYYSYIWEFRHHVNSCNLNSFCTLGVHLRSTRVNQLKYTTALFAYVRPDATIEISDLNYDLCY
jgi:hypothetical protein